MSLVRFVSAALLPLALLTASRAHAEPVAATTYAAEGIQVRVVQIDLGDPHTRLDILLPNGAPRANSARESFGAEAFERMVARTRAAVVMNGTFFSLDAQRRVMGNMTRAGAVVKYSPWENYGTTFNVKPGNRVEMVTARTEGRRPNWEDAWCSLTGGPRLVRDGAIAVHPAREGFRDPNVMGVARRSALGFTSDGRTLYLASFMQGVSLAREAAIMQRLGCYQAMNLDGGPSQALAEVGQVRIPAGCALTNAIAVYDRDHPAPHDLERAYQALLKRRPPR